MRIPFLEVLPPARRKEPAFPTRVVQPGQIISHGRRRCQREKTSAETKDRSPPQNRLDDRNVPPALAGRIDRQARRTLKTFMQTQSFQNRETTSPVPICGSANLPAEEVFGYPVSSAQRRLWFLDQLFPGTPLYNLPLVIGLQEAINPSVLCDCLHAIGLRHETFGPPFDFSREKSSGDFHVSSDLLAYSHT